VTHSTHAGLTTDPQAQREPFGDIPTSLCRVVDLLLTLPLNQLCVLCVNAIVRVYRRASQSELISHVGVSDASDKSCSCSNGSETSTGAVPCVLSQAQPSEADTTTDNSSWRTGMSTILFPAIDH
jgi:hypothetical protein